MTERNRELGYLAAVGALTGLGFASVYIARQSVIGWGSLTYAAFFIGLYLAAHIVALDRGSCGFDHTALPANRHNRSQVRPTSRPPPWPRSRSQIPKGMNSS